MKREYTPKNFGDKALRDIVRAEQICADFFARGYDLTVRQLYYQFVSRDYIPNNAREYNRLAKLVSDARMAGLLDWDYIVDRTRNLRSLPHWNEPQAVIRSAANSWNTEKWATQSTRVEVWIEKDALVGVLQQACDPEDVPYFSCRGYTSTSELWGAAQRVGDYMRAGQDVVICYLGDHDPSGVDMTRDIEDRLNHIIRVDNNHFITAIRDWWIDTSGRTLATIEDGTKYDTTTEEWAELRAGIGEVRRSFGTLHVKRIALTMDQIDQYNPPPNFAKPTDARFQGYVEIYGEDCWELDALDPDVLAALIRESIEEERDDEAWEEAVDKQESARDTLKAIAERWTDVEALINGEAA